MNVWGMTFCIVLACIFIGLLIRDLPGHFDNRNNKTNISILILYIVIETIAWIGFVIFAIGD
jgi:hypothetical protein